MGITFTWESRSYGSLIHMEISFTWESRSCMGATWESHHVHMGITFTLWESRLHGNHVYMGV